MYVITMSCKWVCVIWLVLGSDVNNAWTLEAKTKAWTLRRPRPEALKAKAWALKAKASASILCQANGKIAILTRIFAFLQLQHPWNAYFLREEAFHEMLDFKDKQKYVSNHNFNLSLGLVQG